MFSDYIYEKENIFSGTAKERANALMNFYKDDEIKGIFDISGGDIANGILPYLDYEIIANSKKRFTNSGYQRYRAWGNSKGIIIGQEIYLEE